MLQLTKQGLGIDVPILEKKLERWGVTVLLKMPVWLGRNTIGIIWNASILMAETQRDCWTTFILKSLKCLFKLLFSTISSTPYLILCNNFQLEPLIKPQQIGILKYQKWIKNDMFCKALFLIWSSVRIEILLFFLVFPWFKKQLNLKTVSYFFH